MGMVGSTELAGSIVRRIREDLGMSRAELAERTGIGARTLYALETGESENFGLGNYLRVLDALDLAMSVDLKKPLLAARPTGETKTVDAIHVPWSDLADRWKLEEGGVR